MNKHKLGAGLALSLIGLLGWGYWERSERSRYQEEAVIVRNQLRERSSQVGGAVAERARLLRETAEGQRRLNTLANELASNDLKHRGRVDSLLAEIQHYQKTVLALTGALDKERNKGETVGKELEAERSSTESARKQLALERARVGRAADDLTRDMDRVRQEIKAVSREKKMTAEQVANLKDELSKNEETRDALREDFRQVVEDLAHTSKERDSALSREETARRAAENYYEMARSHDSLVRALRQDLYGLNCKYEQACGEIRHLNAIKIEQSLKIQELQAEVTRLRELLGKRPLADGYPGSKPGRRSSSQDDALARQ